MAPWSTTHTIRRLVERFKTFKSAASFLGLRKNFAVLLAMVILVGTGEKMAERFLPLYLLALGGGTFAVGLLNGLDNLLSAVYSLPGGYFTDRFGHKRALLFFNLLAMAGYVVVILVPSWQAVLIGAILFLSWSAISLPSVMDLIALELPGNKRTMGVSMHSLIRRVPMALGPLIGGGLIGLYGEVDGIRIAFLVALLLAGLSIILQQVFLKTRREPQRGNAARSFGFQLLNPGLRSLLTSDILIRFCEQIPYAFVVVWCVSINRITPFEFGILSAIEMGTAMAVYVPVAYLADKGAKKPYVLLTFVFFTLFPLVLLFADSFWILVPAFILRGLKEFGEPARKALIIDLAPEGRKAATFGIYYMTRDLVVSVAAFGGALLWDASTITLIVDTMGVGSSFLPFFREFAFPAANFLTAFAFGVAGTLWFALRGHNIRA